MRCPDCAKFVSYDEPQVEVMSEDIDEDDGTVTVEVLVQLPCAGCGMVLRSASFELSETPSVDACAAQLTDEELAERRFELHGVLAVPTESRRGKRTYYGVEASATVQCSACGGEEEVTVGDELAASDFEEEV